MTHAEATDAAPADDDADDVGKFAFGDRTIPIHARTRGLSAPPLVMDVYYGMVQPAVCARLTSVKERVLTSTRPRFADCPLGVTRVRP